MIIYWVLRNIVYMIRRMHGLNQKPYTNLVDENNTHKECANKQASKNIRKNRIFMR